MTRLVDDLLDISLISRGAMQLRLEPVNVGAAIGDALETVEPLIKRKHHHVHCELPLRSARVAADSICLTQVFEYLLTNATHGHAAGDLRLRCAESHRSAIGAPSRMCFSIAGGANGHLDAADGYEVARRLNATAEVGHNVTYIAVTGFGQPRDFQRSEEAGFARHLGKPVNPNELDQALRQALVGRVSTS